MRLSCLEVPLDYQLKQWENSKLKDNMFLTAQPLYKTIDIEFEKIIDIVKSDYRQYSPFEFKYGKKLSENWNNDNQDLLILDIDDGLSIAEAKEMFKEYKYLISTTKSHQIDKKGLKCDRFRVILDAINIPAGEDYFNFTKMLEKKYPFIDKQVNTKTGAFLGFADCEHWYNDGKQFDCNPILEAYKRIAAIKTVQETKVMPTAKKANYENELPIDEIKNRLTREIVAEIVSSVGFEVNRKFMFKARPDERTASASISNECIVKDFGDQDAFNDVFSFLMHTKGMNFKESVEYVQRFL